MTNPNIQIEERPKLRAKSANLEHKLQARCVTWFGVTYPERIGQLWAYFAETLNERDGGIKTALGLQPNISDLHLANSGELWGIEMKHVGTQHVTAHILGQAKWLLSVPKRGFFCDSFEEFQKIITTGQGGIDPRIVIERLKSVKTLSCAWNSVRE